MKISVIVVEEAFAHVEKITAWWREHRPAAPFLFEDEFENALFLLGEHPEIGVEAPRPRMENLRKLILPETRYHIYFVYLPDRAEVRIRAVWAAMRGKGPPIRPEEL